MKTEISVNKNFVFRLEDVMYSLLGVVIILFGLFLFNIVKQNTSDQSSFALIILITALVIGIGV